jgi:Helix-turn-helix domain
MDEGSLVNVGNQVKPVTPLDGQRWRVLRTTSGPVTVPDDTFVTVHPETATQPNETAHRPPMKCTATAGERKSRPRTTRAHANSPYYTAEEAVDYLRLPSVKALYALVERKKLIPLKRKRSRHLLFTQEQLDAYVKGR